MYPLYGCPSRCGSGRREDAECGWQMGEGEQEGIAYTDGFLLQDAGILQPMAQASTVRTLLYGIPAMGSAEPDRGGEWRFLHVAP